MHGKEIQRIVASLTSQGLAQSGSWLDQEFSKEPKHKYATREGACIRESTGMQTAIRKDLNLYSRAMYLPRTACHSFTVYSPAGKVP